MLINMRNAMMAGGGWKNPYVTDGLVSMWDGEWNAGGGVHDASATTWKDLCGNHDLNITALSSIVSWDAKSVDYHRTSKTDGNNEYYFYSDDNIYLALGSSYTLECAFLVRENSQPIYRGVCGQGGDRYRGVRIDLEASTTGLEAGTADNGAIISLSSFFSLNTLLSVCVSVSNGYGFVYVGAEKRTNERYFNAINKRGFALGAAYTQKDVHVGLNLTPTAHFRTLNGKIYRCALYNRALTPTEVETNFLVDTNRFQTL